MPFSAYDSGSVRLLSAVLADATISARKTIGHPLSEREISTLSEMLVQGLTKAHDAGERDPDALKRAAVRSALVWQTMN